MVKGINTTFRKGFFNFFLDFYTKLVSSLVWTSEEGALTELYLGVATEDIQEKQLRGKYFHPQSVEVVNPYAENAPAGR